MKKRVVLLLIIVFLGFLFLQNFTGFMVYNKNNVKIQEAFMQDIEAKNAIFHDDNNNGMIDRIELKDKSASIKIKSKEKERVIIRYKNENLAIKELSKNEINNFLEDKNIERITLDLKYNLTLQDTVPLIKADLLHNINVTGSNYSVCVLDSGIYSEHPDFNNRIINEHCYADNDFAGDVIGYCANNSEEFGDANDDIGHGTLVAGIVAASKGLNGVANNANLVVVKICNSYGQCAYSDLVKGIDYCIANKNRYNIKVITLSLGTGYVYSDLESCNLDNLEVTTAVNNAFAAGIFIDSSSGNSASRVGISAPACLANITSVGATTKSDSIASYSNIGNLLDVVAPGSYINTTSCVGTYSLCNPSGYANKYSGTSFASPHVAGAAILMIDYTKQKYNIDLTPSELMDIIKKGVDINYNNKTYKRVDLNSSVNYLDSYLNESLDAWSDLDKEKPFYYFKEYLENITFYAKLVKRNEVQKSISCYLEIENQTYILTFNEAKNAFEFSKYINNFSEFAFNVNCNNKTLNKTVTKNDFDFYLNHSIKFFIKNMENKSLTNISFLVYEYNSSNYLYNQSISNGDTLNFTEFFVIDSEFINKTPHKIIIYYNSSIEEKNLIINQSFLDENLENTFYLNVSDATQENKNETIQPLTPSGSSSGGSSSGGSIIKESPKKYELFENEPVKEDTRILEEKEPLKEYQDITIIEGKEIKKFDSGFFIDILILIGLLFLIRIRFNHKRPK